MKNFSIGSKRSPNKAACIISTIMMLLFVSICVPAMQANVHSQSSKKMFTIRAGSIQEALKQIERSSDYVSVVSDNAKKSISQKAAIEIDSDDIDYVVNTMLSHSGTSYRILDKQIVIYEGNQTAQQVTKTIKGVVLDQHHAPLIGVSVRLAEAGSTKGTTTDIDGNFTLTNIPANAVLLVSYIGMKNVEYKVKDEETIKIVMQENTDVLDEIVVIGYGVQKKVNLSGSIATVTSQTLKDRPVTNSIQALQGVAGNLNIANTTGQATGTPSINIRGYGSLNGNNIEPLVVIDGIVSSVGDLKDINPQDIENISVLKDAASAAIYGARAGFGVILVTTKGGVGSGPERLKISYDNNFSFRKLGIRPDIITDPATVVEMRNVFSYPWYNLYDENEVQYAKQRSADPSVSPYYLNEENRWKYFGSTDWFKEAYKDFGFSTNHNVAISGATEKVSYYLSAAYNKQDGLLREANDKFNRYNIRSKLNFKITDWWQIGNNTSYVTTDYDKPTYLGGDYYWSVSRKNPLDVPRNPDGSWTEVGASILGRMQEGGRSKDLYQRLQTQFTTKVNLYKDILTAHGSFALTRYNSTSESAALSTEFREGPELTPKKMNEVTSASESATHQDNILFDAYLNYAQTFSEKHFVNAMVGYNQEEEKYKYFSGSIKDLISESLPNMGLGTGDRNVSSSRTEYALRSMFYRVNYIYDNKYIIEHNGRYDGTSRFPKNDRFVYNPSVSLAWVATQEPFFAPLLETVSHLKLRASYGKLGNQQVGNYAYIPTMSKGKTSWLLDGKQPVYVSAPGLVSSSLTWEVVTTKNIGLDLNFLGNRLSTAFDYYHRDTEDMLIAGAELPSVLGTSVPRENSANLRTKGFELSIGWTDSFTLGGKPFNYNASFILSDSSTEITKFSNPTGSLNSNYKGKKIGEIWGLTTLGYFTSKEDVANHADQTTVTTYPGTFDLDAGDVKFLDRNKDGKVDWGKWTLEDSGDFHVIGNTSPRYLYSFNLGADWNNFDMNLFFQGIGKRDYYPGSGDLFFWGMYSQPWTNVTTGNMDYWTPENPNAYFPRRKGYTAEISNKELGAPQTKYLQNASYLRMKNITFGYTLPKSLTRKINVEKLRVYFSGENLFEFTGLDSHYKVDPEGLGGQMYPFQRSVSFGLNVSF